MVLGIVDLAGTVLPVVDMRRRLNLPPRGLRLSDHLLVARAGSRTVALLVDEATGVLVGSPEAVVAAEAILPELELLAGAVKLEDGLVLIHDLERTLSLEEGRALDQALQQRAGGAGLPAAVPRHQPEPGGR